MSIRGERGFGLILLITLIAITSIFLAGTTIFVTNAAREAQLKTDRIKAASLAQAGVLQALHNWRVSNASDAARTYTELQTTVFGVQAYRTAATQSSFAYFMFNNPSNANWTPNSRTLRGWTIRNIHAAGATSVSNLTVTHARVTWVPQGNANRRLSGIRLNNVAVFGGSAINGALITLTGSAAARTLAPGASWSGNNTYLQWNAGMPNDVRVTVEWTFSDHTATRHSRSHQVEYWNGVQADEAGVGGRPSRHTFSIVTTGQVNETSKLPAVMDSVKATVSGDAGGFMEIIDWDRMDQNLFA